MRRRLDIALAKPAEPGSLAPKLLNALLPGAGLVRLDYVLAGLSIGLFTWAPLTSAAFVVWLAPGSLPTLAVMAMTALGLVGYILAQAALAWALARQPIRQAEYLARTGPALSAAYDQFARGNMLAAQLQLDIVLAADREHFEANLLQARLLAIQGKFDQARQAYTRCRRLDSGGRWRWELERELAALPR